MYSTECFRTRAQSPWFLVTSGTFCAVLLLLVGCSSTEDGATTDAEAANASVDVHHSTAAEYVDAIRKRLTLEAENAFLEAELSRNRTQDGLGPFSAEVADRLEHAKVDSKKAFADFLEANFLPVERELAQKDLMAVREHVKTLAEQAVRVRRQIYKRKTQIFELKASERAVGQLATLLGPQNLPFCLFGVLGIGAVVGIVVHERRHEYRRMLNGFRARRYRLLTVLKSLLGGVSVLTAIVVSDHYLLGNRLYHSLLVIGADSEDSPRSEFAREIADINAVVSRLEENNEELRTQSTKAETACRARLAALIGEAELLDHWARFREHVREIAVGLQVEKELADEVEKDTARLTELETDHSQIFAATGKYRKRQAVIRGSAGLSLVLLVALSGGLFWRSVNRKRRTIEQTCPQCLGVGTLQPTSMNGAPKSTTKHLELLQCKNTIVSVDEYGDETEEDCGFTFRTVYQRLPKLCFPTLGIPSSGKTVWLAMVYRELNRGNFPRRIHFERIKTDSSADFDRTVEDLLIARMEPGATQTARIPHPLVFNFRDTDRWGSSNILVNMFDYSGEITSDRSLSNAHRQRALDGDGFVFIVDPTEPSERQAKALVDFREDLRLIKGVQAGQEIRVPVAVCVSKIDTLVTQPYASPEGGDAIEGFYGALKLIDPTGEATSLNVIEERSQLVAELRDTIWPGWHIERTIHDLFGGRFMFFPMTPFGLEDVGMDLRDKTIIPFGILEPFLWLLHMNGYPVLDYE